MQTFNAILQWFLQPPSQNEKVAREVAEAAMRRVHRKWNRASLRIEDIGLLVYHSGSEPKICRVTKVPTDASHIRPFIVLHQPPMPRASGLGRLQFVLRDYAGEIRYRSLATYQLKTGKNFITSQTWLPLEDVSVGATWTLEVDMSSTPLALHAFGWMEVGGLMRTQFDGDGEMGKRTMQSMKLRGLDPLSLDDLLAAQNAQSADDDA